MKRQSICKCGQATILESDNEKELDKLEKIYKVCKKCGAKIVYDK